MQEFDEYSKISIHNHFGGDHTFDRAYDEKIDKELSFDWEYSAKILDDAKKSRFNILVSTNQNVFNSCKFYLLSKLARKYEVLLLPGIEINLQNSTNEKVLHTVIVFNPLDNLLEIELSIKDKYIVNKKNCLTVDDLVNIIIGKKAILIPHGIKQNDRSLACNQNMKDFLFSLENAFPVLIEDNQTYHKASLRKEIESFLNDEELIWFDSLPSVSGADRKLPSEIESPTYIWGNSTFDDVYYAALMNDGKKNTRIKRKDDIVTKIGYIKKIEICKSKNTAIETGSLYCSHGLNAIVGSSGSGKTLLLSILKRKLTGEELVNKTIKNKDYKEISDVNDVILYDENGKEIQFKNISVFEGENLYNKIIEAYDSNKDTLLKQFDINIDMSLVNTITSRFENDFNELISRAKQLKIAQTKSIDNLRNINNTIEFLHKNILSSKHTLSYTITENFDTKLSVINRRINQLNTDYTNVTIHFKGIIEAAARYMDVKWINGLQEFKNQLLREIEKNKLLAEIENLKIDLIKSKKSLLFKNAQINNRKMGELNEQITLKKQELFDFNSNLLKYIKSTYLLKRNSYTPLILKSQIKEGIKLVGNDYAHINVKEPNLTFLKDHLTSIFPNDVSQNTSKNKIGLVNFKKQYNFESAQDIKELAQPFIESENYSNIQFVLPLKETIDYEILLSTIDGDNLSIENITAGSLSKIYVKKMFDDSLKGKNTKTIIIYDQPDSNMEKEFILDELVEKIKDLKNRYQIFITTHEPLLVINADANNIIQAQNEKKITKSLNIYYKNITLKESRTKKEAFLNLSKLIDGSHKAVEFRNKIYGGMINENYN